MNPFLVKLGPGHSVVFNSLSELVTYILELNQENEELVKGLLDIRDTSHECSSCSAFSIAEATLAKMKSRSST